MTKLEIELVSLPTLKISKVSNKYRLKKLTKGAPGIGGTWHILFLDETEMTTIKELMLSEEGDFR